MEQLSASIGARMRRSLAAPLLLIQSSLLGTALLLTLGAIWLAQKDKGQTMLPPTIPSPTAAAPLVGTVISSVRQGELATTTSVKRLAEIHTIIPDRPRYQVITYTVAKNDTLFGIAAKFNLKPETILWGNPTLAEDPNSLRVGQTLNILPIDGALRVVMAGDNLEKIARAFHGTVEDIINYPGNGLDPADPQIREGQYIIIPGGWRDSITWQLPVPPSRRVAGRSWASDEPGACAGPFSGPTGTYTFVWPTNNHYLSNNGVGTDYMPRGHPAIDLAAGLGAPIYAADTGVVVFSGWSNRGYGNLVIIDHGNGWQTAYAHFSQINVSCGAAVYQGQLIGLAGSTGNSTGAHLHFEMRHVEYGRVNPWLYLPPP